MRHFARWGATLSLAAGLGTAGAAGILGTSQSVSTSAFCQQYKCTLLDNSGREWLYDLNVPGSQMLLVQRESSEPGSRVTQISLLSDNDDVNIDLDRKTFGDVQKLALGFVSNAGRLDACYTLNGATYRIMADAPDERTRRIYCDWDEAYTRFVIEADRNYLARTAPASVPTTGPTKLNTWSFTGCTVAGSPSEYLPTGKPARCTLVITTKGAASQVVRAEFQYEIEYVQNGQYVKKILPEKEYWWPGRAQQPLDPRVTQQGRTVSANLSLAIKSVPGRRVISLNTIAKLTFANGTVKTAYEPLTVR
ncbi:hypothetical protein WDJ50_14190 [Deinococcus sp. VB142]|uniref:Uncharacterized protein n=1 Tax=Deinococcus sp. VB142 TaxID=3112952 RepID=A0AAU6Q2M1_9DEIO